jgi:hypothetical protein
MKGVAMACAYDDLKSNIQFRENAAPLRSGAGGQKTQGFVALAKNTRFCCADLAN